MLRLSNGLDIGKSAQKTWVIKSKELLLRGIRSPQGFTFSFGVNRTDNYFWTTNEFAAYLFHKRYKLSDNRVTEDFERIRAKEDYLYKLSYSTESDMKYKCPANVEYRPHQASGIEYCLNTNNVIIADEQRIGKTAVAIGVINNLHNINKVLVLCPKTAKLGWGEELDKWLVVDHKVQVLNSKSIVDPDANIYVANYDILHIKKDLLDIQYDLVIPDECHLVARAETRRAKFFLSLSARKIIGLSGTPLLNNPKDLLTIAQWLDPFWKQFLFRNDKYVSQSGISLGLEEAQEMMRSSLLIRRLQAQVFEGEPIDKRVVPIEPTDIVKPYIGAEMNKIPIEEWGKIRKILGVHKVQYALNHIDTYSTEGEKLVVFAYHNEVIERLKSSLGNKAVCIYGPTSEKDRALAKERFNNDPTCTVLLGSIGSASMALNLSVSCHVIFVECDWSNGMMAQAQERCSDKEQKSPVTVEYLVFDKSLDYYLLNKIDVKDAVVDRGIDMIYS